MKNKNISPIYVVFRHWKDAFEKNKWLLFLTLIFYSTATYVDLILKPIYFKKLIDTLTLKGDAMYFFWAIVLCHLLVWITSRAGDFILTVSESNIIKRLTDYSLFGLLKKNSRFFADNFVGSLVAKSRRFSYQSKSIIDQIVFNILRTIILILCLFWYLFIAIKIVFYLFAVWTILFVFITVIFSGGIMNKNIISAQKDSIVTGVFSDIISSLRYFRLFGREEAEYNNFTEISLVAEEHKRKAWFLDNIQWVIQVALVAILEILVIYIMILKIKDGEETIGTFAMIEMYVISLALSMYNLGQGLVNIRSGMADAYEMSETLDKHSDESETIELPKPIEIENSEIVFDNVSFTYEIGSGSHSHVIEGFNFKFSEGRHYGIIGESGAGKSTLMKLLLREYDHNVGRIEIGGIETNSISKPTLRSLISFVPQQPAFPSRKIIEILKLGNHNADQEVIIKACQDAGCDFIWEKFPNKFETYVGERGVNLSGGEAQRLAIAVAIIKNAPIVVMDEPTSALDAETELIVQRSIKKIFKGKTIIVIAHRLSTVAVLDEILFLKEGKVFVCGSHEELLESSSEYSNLWRLQTEPEI